MQRTAQIEVRLEKSEKRPLHISGFMGDVCIYEDDNIHAVVRISKDKTYAVYVKAYSSTRKPLRILHRFNNFCDARDCAQKYTNEFIEQGFKIVQSR